MGLLPPRVMANDSTTYRIVLGGRIARPCAPSRRASQILVRATPPDRWMAGWHGRAWMPMMLPADNVRHFAVWIGAAPKVSVSSAAGPFVRSALDVLRGDGRVADGGDVAILPADELAQLPALIVAPSDPVRVGAANRALEHAGFHARFGRHSARLGNGSW